MKTISESTLSAMAVVISTWVVATGVYLCILNPEHAVPYMVAIAVVCVAWTVRYFAGGDAGADSKSRAARRELTLGIVFSGLLLGVALDFKLIEHLGWMTGFVRELAQRSNGFMVGAIVVVFANAIPKQVSSARGLVVLRIAGWALVLGGLGYALAWLLLPLSYANDAALLVMLLGLTYAVVRIAWYSATHRSIPPPPTG